MKISIGVLAALFAGATCVSVDSAFMNFIARFGRSYSTKEERETRFAAFKRTFELVEAHNAHPSATSRLGINQFADLTAEELSDRFQASLPEDFESIPKVDVSTLQTIDALPNSTDWTQTGYVGRVYDQGKCLAGWAFATADSLGMALSIVNQQAYKKNDVSAQYLIDCDVYNYGCTRGNPWNGYRYIQKAGYVEWEDYGAYKGVQRPCSVRGSLQYVPYLLPTFFPILSVDNMKLLVTQQPVATYMNVPACVVSYVSGVLRDSDCQCSDSTYFALEQPQQAVVVVGYSVNDETPGCSGYWLVKNSWGASWGESGYIKLCIPTDPLALKMGTCNVLGYPQIPDVGIVTYV